MLDTEKKRRSSIAIGAYFLGPSVLPDTSGLDEAERQVAGYGYYGILVDPPVELETGDSSLFVQREALFGDMFN